MAPTSSVTGLRAVSLICLMAAAQALPQQTSKRGDPFTRKGCYADKSDNHRLLDSASFADDAMTVETCAGFCSNLRYKYFGLEYGRECYCGDDYSGDVLSDSECSFECSGNAAETCGGKVRLDLYSNNLYSPRKPATLATPYLGCFVDQGPRTLPDNLLGDNALTAEKCAAHCSDYKYFGVEYGRECWCGNSQPQTIAAESECSFACAGDDAQLCGAGNRINVWGPLPTPPTIGEFEYAGCFTDDNDDRSLTGRVSYDPAMTPEKCAAFCSAYSYFGLEFGSQCYCGTTLKDSAEERPETECSMRCGGDYYMCGDADRLSVFATPDCKEDPENLPVTGFNYQSCWADQVDARALTGDELRSDDMTVEKCATFCQGYKYFGLEYARECYCGNELAGAAAAEDQCSNLCMGDATQWCGAPDRLNIYTATVATPAATDVPTVTVTPAESVTTA